MFRLYKLTVNNRQTFGVTDFVVAQGILLLVEHKFQNDRADLPLAKYRHRVDRSKSFNMVNRRWQCFL
jgi:hypothetical protein